jgi:hypothetical protein
VVLEILVNKQFEKIVINVEPYGSNQQRTKDEDDVKNNKP